MAVELQMLNVVVAYNRGYTASELGRHYNCNTQTIINRLRNFGVETRKQGQHTSKSKEKLSRAKIGENNPMWKGAQTEFVCENCGTKSEAYDNGIRKFRFCSNKCAHENMPNPTKGKFGKEHPVWKEEKVTPLRTSIRKSQKYTDWRTSVFERDDYTCQECLVRGGTLEAHHNVPFRKIIKNINSYDDALDCEQLWDVDNGTTVCIECHRKIDKLRN